MLGVSLSSMVTLKQQLHFMARMMSSIKPADGRS